MDNAELYLLAGLGFDHRIFSNLSLQKGHINYLQWLEPDSNENLESYVLKMTNQIKESEKPIILVGHSFGGIIVQEISKLIKAKKVIIISSIKSKDEIPITLKFLKSVPLYNLFNKKIILKTFPVWARAFGYNSAKGRALFILMISNCTDNYFKWAMDKIVHFEGNDNIRNIVHIHGSRDKTFPLRLIINPIVIPDGSHFMVFSRAEEVSEVINIELKKNYSARIESINDSPKFVN